MVNSKARGIWLTIWLSILLVGGIFSSIANLFFGNFAFQLDPTLPIWTYVIFGLLGVCNVIFLIFLFMWKRWAFYGFLASTVIVFIINLYVGVQFILALMGFIGVLILYLSMRSRWKLFD